MSVAVMLSVTTADHGRVEHQGAWLAPPVRVYLDLLGERRGADAAAHFLDVVLKAQS